MIYLKLRGKLENNNNWHKILRLFLAQNERKTNKNVSCTLKPENQLALIFETFNKLHFILMEILLKS